jgi:hypothetical protein
MIFVEFAVLAIGAMLAASLLRALPPSPRRRRPPRQDGRPATSPDLATLEQVLSIAQDNAFDVHVRLRPVLREIAADRLAGRRIALDDQPEPARAALGEELRELVRPERPSPADPRAPGLSFERLQAFVTTLEDL